MAAVLQHLCLCALIVLTDTVKNAQYGAVKRKKEVSKNVLGKPEQGYFIEILLGSPSQKLNVVLDTGSANFAVAGSEAAGIDLFFDPSKSRSFTGKPDRGINVRYSNGSWDGFFASDTLKLCQSCNSSGVDLALIISSSNFFVSRDLWQGILGLGYQALIQPSPNAAVSVLDSLYNHHVITDQIFSLTLCGQNDRDTSDMHGTFELEAVPDSAFIYTNVVKEWYYQIEITDMAVNGTSIGVKCSELNDPLAFIDSGTTNIILPTELYYTVIATIENYAAKLQRPELPNLTLRNFLTRSQYLCVPPADNNTTNNSSVFDWFPELHVFVAFNSTHHFSVNLPPQQYIRQNMSSMKEENKFSEKTYCYTIAIEAGHIGTVLGTCFMEQLNVLHDKTHRRVGFKVDNSTCNVTDPFFVKKISDITDRSQSALACLPTSRHRPPIVSLLVTICLFFFMTLILVGVLFYRTKLQKLSRQCKTWCCCSGLWWCSETKYSYMMNSDDEDEDGEESILRNDEDEESILRNDEDEVNLGYSSKLQLPVDDESS